MRSRFTAGRTRIVASSGAIGLGAVGLGAVALVWGLTACSGSGPTSPAPPGTSGTAPLASSPASPTSSQTSFPSSSETSGSPTPTPDPPSTISEPTTTNTLPPPPDPTKAAASTAGTLTAAVLPVPTGWHTVIRRGDQEEGYRGNGTWVHARDPRYAATDTVTIGCAEVTRDNFTDPASALEGSYENAAGEPGVGLAMQFSTPAAASHYFALYRRQVSACTDPDGPMTATILTSQLGLIDHRTYPADDEWTEVVKLDGRRITLIALTDPGHRIGLSRAETILRSVPR